jgi:Gpi18-like mannosyltransferase
MSENKTSHTAGAVIVSIVVFLVCIYVVAPLSSRIFDLFGRYFVPARFGGGEDVNNPGILSLLFRSCVTSYASAYASFYLSKKAFCRANIKIVAVILVCFIGIFTFLFTYTFLKSDGIIALTIPLGLFPAIYLSFTTFKNAEEEIKRG